VAMLLPAARMMIALASSSSLPPLSSPPLTKEDSSQLLVWWSSRNSDNWVSTRGQAHPGYSPDAVSDGAVSVATGTGSSPLSARRTLTQWWCAERKDHVLTGSTQGATFVSQNHCQKLRAVGSIAAAPPDAGSPERHFFSPVWMFQNDMRQDSVLVMTGWWSQFLQAAGYKRVWAEGWADNRTFSPPPSPPPSPSPTPHGPPSPAPPLPTPHDWQPFADQPPSDCPFERSKLFDTASFDGRTNAYPGYSSQGCGAGHSWCGGDTFYPAFGKDGTIYTGFTDGPTFGVFPQAWGGPHASTGWMIARGDVMNLTMGPNLGPNMIGKTTNPATPYGGRYPCANVYANGTWYYGTYLLSHAGSGAECGNPNWPIQGPFVGFRTSTDRGASMMTPVALKRARTAVTMAVQLHNDDLFSSPSQSESEFSDGRAPRGLIRGMI
jgi:hypothetical protein